jgi:hypothetical protein
MRSPDCAGEVLFLIVTGRCLLAARLLGGQGHPRF